MKMNKLPQITFLFWIMKISATTLGETAGDQLSMTMNIGYALSSVILISFFTLTLVAQLLSKKHYPVIYWAVILATSMAGTTMSDFMNRSMGFGYALGSSILTMLLVLTLLIWKKMEKSLSVTHIKSFRGEIFYWAAILFSNTLGTSVGDYLADSSGLGFSGGAIVIGLLLLIIVMLHYLSTISPVILFWLAFVLTRPFGATFGDLLTKTVDKGGIGFGTSGTSLVLFGVLLVFLVYAVISKNKTVTNKSA
jgi:uncharacterized membrane-anchored protein